MNIYQGWQFIVAVLGSQFLLVSWFSIVMWRNRASRLRGDFWQILQTRMVDLIHHPHPESRELDILLEKLEADPKNRTANGLTEDGRKRLEALLREKANDREMSKDERNEAEFLLIAMREVVKEDARK